MKKFTRFDEIISKEQWDTEYHKKVKINQEQYDKVKPYLIQMFTNLNGGTYADTVVFDYSSIKLEDITDQDQAFIDAVAQMGYEITKESYLAGQMSKKGKSINIMDFIGSLKSRIKSYDKMADTYKKTSSEDIKKQLDGIDKLKSSGLISGDEVSLDDLTIYDYKRGEQKIVFTMDIRAVASQSSFVGWKSCMRLNPDGNSDQGMYANMVGPGISAGNFIAYLTRVGDEKELENPLGRVLLKPYAMFNDEGGIEKLTWFPSKYYPSNEQNPNFLKRVENVMSQYAPKVEGFSRLTIHPDIYVEPDDKRIKTINREKVVDLSPEDQLAAIKRIPSLIKYLDSPTDEMIEIALNKNGENIKYIKNEKLQLQAIKNNVRLLKHIKNPSVELQLDAINADKEAIDYIDNPSDEAIALAKQLGADLQESITKKYIKFFKEEDTMISQDIQARPENAAEVAKVPVGDEEEEKKKKLKKTSDK